MSRDMLIAAAAGALSGMAAMSFFGGGAGSVLFVYFAALPLFMAAFAMGKAATTVAVAVGIIVTAVTGGEGAALLFGLVYGFPVWLTARLVLARTNTPAGKVGRFTPGEILCWLAIVGAVSFIMGAVAIGLDGSSVRSEVAAFIDRGLTTLAPGLDDEERLHWGGTLTAVFPGLFGASWVMMTALNAALAQSLLLRLGRGLRPSPMQAGFRVPEWMSWLLVAAAAVALFAPGDVEYAGETVVMMFAVPFFFLGIATVHALAARLPYRSMLLVAFYLIVLISGWAALVVAGIGLVEQWIGLSHRGAGPNDAEEVE